MGLSHIKLAKPDIVELKRQDCPTCGKSRFFVSWHEAWYGWYDTCLKCGERFCCGQMERPFAPRWRQHNIESAKRFYRRHRRKGNN